MISALESIGCYAGNREWEKKEQEEREKRTKEERERKEQEEKEERQRKEEEEEKEKEGMKRICLHSYEAQEGNELSFSKGDILDVLEVLTRTPLPVLFFCFHASFFCYCCFSLLLFSCVFFGFYYPFPPFLSVTISFSFFSSPFCYFRKEIPMDGG